MLTHALAFLCPSVYEPLGIVNLEAMACETAVVASGVGGIPEVVVDGETGLLVALRRAGRRRLRARASPTAVNRLAGDPELAAAMGRAGRERAVGVVRLGRRSRRRPSTCTARCAERRIRRSVLRVGAVPADRPLSGRLDRTFNVHRASRLAVITPLPDTGAAGRAEARTTEGVST